MKIQRMWWIATRKEDGAIFSGMPNYLDFRTRDTLAMNPIKFYQSPSLALSNAHASTKLDKHDIVVVQVREVVESV